MFNPHLSDILLGQAPPKNNDLLTKFVGFLPSISVVEAVVIRQLEPQCLIRVLAVSLHDAVPGWSMLVQLVQKPILIDNLVYIGLHRQVRNDYIVLCDGEVMQHPRCRCRDGHAIYHLPVLVK